MDYRERLDMERRRYLAGWNHARQTEADIGVRLVVPGYEPQTPWPATPSPFPIHVYTQGNRKP